MYDLIYLADEEEYGRAWEELGEAFPQATVEDASDFIHPYRICVEVEMETVDYREKILELGMCKVSFDFELFCLDKPEVALAFIKSWREKKDM